MPPFFLHGVHLGADRWRNPARVTGKAPGKKRALLEVWFDGPEGPQALFAGRALPFNEKAGHVWARLMADGTARGRPRNALDMIIAAIAEANDCVVVTDNEKDLTKIRQSASGLNVLRRTTVFYEARAEYLRDFDVRLTTKKRLRDD